MARKKNRFSRLEMSNRAHERIANYHSRNEDKYSEYDRFTKAPYHRSVIRRQKQEKRILTQEERKAVWRATEYFYFN